MAADMFSPQAFPPGRVLYEWIVSLPPKSHLDLSPFEIAREPLVVVAVADGMEISAIQGNQSNGYHGQGNEDMMTGSALRQLLDHPGSLKESYPNALVHQLMVFEYPRSKQAYLRMADVMLIPPPQASRTTTMKTVVCDLTSSILAEMTTFARYLQGLPTIDTPSKSTPGAPLPVSEKPKGSRWSALLSSARSSPTRMGGSPDRSQVRMSMPTQLPSSANGYAERPGSASGMRSPPATFDEIAKTTDLSGSTSRDSSRDRISKQDAAVISANDRMRSRGRSRTGIAVGSLYLLAGQWPEALRYLVEHTETAKTNSDYVWHAKGLEYILMCLILLGWTQLEFQVCWLDAYNIPNLQHSSTHQTTDSSYLLSLSRSIVHIFV